MHHTCERVGNRQMLSIGGYDPTAPTVTEGFQTSDPNTNTLGIFDMVDLTWKSSYDADAEPYTIPTAVGDWYNQP